MPTTSRPNDHPADGSDVLRLLWPQWQGAGAGDVAELASELPFDDARRGYAVGTTVLDAVLPRHRGPTAVVPVRLDDAGLEERDGIEAKSVVVDQLRAAVGILDDHAPRRVATLGGECSVSVAPFSYLAARYGDDLAVVWVDAHPDVGTPASEYHGYHAMAVSVLTGHGDAEVHDVLPATVPASRVALVGLHAWAEDDIANVTEWGITSFAPDTVRDSTRPVLDWLAATGCTRVAVHFDVDVVDGDEVVLGLGAEPHGLTGDQAARVVADLGAAADVVGLTVAEYIPRQVLRLRRILRGFPLLSD